MRFQGVSPDSLSRFRSPSRTEDQIFSQYFAGGGDGDGTPPQSKNNEAKSTVAGGNGSGGDMLLQWGQRKRSRCSRTENRSAVGVTTTDDSSSSSSTQFHGGVKKVPRRVVVVVDKQKKPSSSGTTNTNANIMPPPPSLVPCSTSNGRGGNLKPPCSKDTIAFSPNWRNSEERSGGGNGSPPSNSGGTGRPVSPRSRVGKRSPTPKEKYDNNSKINNPSSSGSASLRNERLKNGSNLIQQHHQEAPDLLVINDNIHSSAPPQPGPEATSLGIVDYDDHHLNSTAKTSKGGKEIVNGSCGGSGGGTVNVWPRIYIPLTRKEKEEDFLAMKGTKLPHRPKKRPKAIDRVLQYCYPGMWLGDVTRARYEVKEKKSAKKQRRRGLKGMESMESDSDQ